MKDTFTGKERKLVRLCRGFKMNLGRLLYIPSNCKDAEDKVDDKDTECVTPHSSSMNKQDHTWAMQQTLLQFPGHTMML